MTAATSGGGRARSEGSIATGTHGRYLLERPRDAEATALLVGFHGYAQRAETSMSSLQRLAGDRPWALLAPQGLHGFYNRRSGEVVASWMTRQLRELAIDDNVAYLGRLLAGVREDLAEVRRIGLVGFSQGVAMAYRTAARAGCRTDALVVVAGDLPPELDEELSGLPPVLVGRGEDDPSYTGEKMAADLARLQGTGVEVEPCVYPGGHCWEPRVVARAAAFLEDRLAL